MPSPEVVGDGILVEVGIPCDGEVERHRRPALVPRHDSHRTAVLGVDPHAPGQTIDVGVAASVAEPSANVDPQAR